MVGGVQKATGPFGSQIFQSTSAGSLPRRVSPATAEVSQRFFTHPQWKPPTLFQTYQPAMGPGIPSRLTELIAADPSQQFAQLSSLDQHGLVRDAQQFVSQTLYPTALRVLDLDLTFRAVRFNAANAEQRELYATISREDRQAISAALPGVVHHYLELLHAHDALTDDFGMQIRYVGWEAWPRYCMLLQKMATAGSLSVGEHAQLQQNRLLVQRAIEKGVHVAARTEREALILAATQWGMLRDRGDVPAESMTSRELLAISPWALEAFESAVAKGASRDDAWAFLLWADRSLAEITTHAEMTWVADREARGKSLKLAYSNTGDWQAAWEQWRIGRTSGEEVTLSAFLEDGYRNGVEQHWWREGEPLKTFSKRIRRALMAMGKTGSVWREMAEGFAARTGHDASAEAVLHPINDVEWLPASSEPTVEKIAKGTRIAHAALERRAGVALPLRMPTPDDNRTTKDVLREGSFIRYFDPHLRTRVFTNVAVQDEKLQVHHIYDDHGNMNPNVVGILLMLPGGGTMHSHSGAAMYAARQLSERVVDGAGRQLRMPDGSPALLATIGIDNPAHGEGPAWEEFPDVGAFMGYYESLVNYLGGFGVPIIGLGRSLGADIYAQLAQDRPGLLVGTHEMGGEDPKWAVHAFRYLFEQFVGKDGKRAEKNLPGLSLIMRLFGMWPHDRTITDAEVTAKNLEHLAANQDAEFSYFNGLNDRIATMAATAPSFEHHGISHTFAQVMQLNWGLIEAEDSQTWGAIQDYLAAVRARAGLKARQTPGTVLYGQMDEEYPQPEAWLTMQRYCAAFGLRFISNPKAGHDHFDPRRTEKRDRHFSFSRVAQANFNWINSWRGARGLPLLKTA